MHFQIKSLYFDFSIKLKDFWLFPEHSYWVVCCIFLKYFGGFSNYINSEQVKKDKTKTKLQQICFWTFLRRWINIFSVPILQVYSKKVLIKNSPKILTFSEQIRKQMILKSYGVHAQNWCTQGLDTCCAPFLPLNQKMLLLTAGNIVL